MGAPSDNGQAAQMCAFYGCRLPEAGVLDAVADGRAMRIPLCLSHVLVTQVMEQKLDVGVIVGLVLAMSRRQDIIAAADKLLGMSPFESSLLLPEEESDGVVRDHRDRAGVAGLHDDEVEEGS